jgi:iron(II)-dependent oxidoreductase
VTVPSFEMLKTEVTVNQYKACVDAGKCDKPRDKSDSSYCNWGYSDRGNHPINCVDWSQARAYCQWTGGRLPSEAEWEYAARGGGKSRKYPWGDQTATCDYAVMSGEGKNGCGQDRTWPVCSKQSGDTIQGLCDMAGNVWEWVEDLYHDTYKGAPADGSAWTSGGEEKRVIRGGSWDYGYPDFLRASNRNRNNNNSAPMAAGRKTERRHRGFILRNVLSRQGVAKQRVAGALMSFFK